MALEARLLQKLQQKLVMTPQLRQAIKILQLQREELDTLIDEELAENPVLERAEGEEPLPEEPPMEAEIASGGDRCPATRRYQLASRISTRITRHCRPCRPLAVMMMMMTVSVFGKYSDAHGIPGRPPVGPTPIS